MLVQAYLFFDGRTEEAIEHYRKTLGAQDIVIVRFKEMPQPHPPGSIPPGAENKVMHANFRIGDTQIMASDGQCLGKMVFDGFALSITAADDAEAERLFAAISDGGVVQIPMSKTFFASRFGMTSDKFGVVWMVITGAPGA